MTQAVRRQQRGVGPRGDGDGAAAAIARAEPLPGRRERERVRRTRRTLRPREPVEREQAQIETLAHASGVVVVMVIRPASRARVGGAKPGRPRGGGVPALKRRDADAPFADPARGADDVQRGGPQSPRDVVSALVAVVRGLAERGDEPPAGQR
eukprot:20945-Pelagococcus_subviridis.AAC.5